MHLDWLPVSLHKVTAKAHPELLQLLTPSVWSCSFLPSFRCWADTRTGCRRRTAEVTVQPRTSGLWLIAITYTQAPWLAAGSYSDWYPTTQLSPGEVGAGGSKSDGHIWSTCPEGGRRWSADVCWLRVPKNWARSQGSKWLKLIVLPELPWEFRLQCLAKPFIQNCLWGTNAASSSLEGQASTLLEGGRQKEESSAPFLLHQHGQGLPRVQR